ncbi:MAG: tetratricopeptide repeat protein [Cyclobacteriaceae bacterium]|nr:tetratricopeptide repeat protein [Cyclobacteriaceae bacterium]
MANERTSNSVRVRRSVKLAIASAFLLALLWPLGSFFRWLFVGSTSYFIFLSFYYSPREQSSERRDYSNSNRAEPDKKQTPFKRFNKNLLKRISLIVVISSFSVLLILMVIGFIWGDESANTTLLEEENRTALKADPANLDALTNLGNLFYAQEEYDSALSYYEKVLAIDPQNSSGTYNKSLVFYQKKDYSKSIEWSKKAILINPENTDAIVITGDSYYEQGNFNEASAWFQKAYLQGARGGEMLYLMGFIYDKQNDRAKAIQFYKESLQQDSSYVEIYDRLIQLDPAQAPRYKKMAAKWK